MTKLEALRFFSPLSTGARKTRRVGKLTLAQMTCIVLMFCVATAIAMPAQTYTILHNFGTAPNDPNDPRFAGIIVQGRDGNMYSTSPQVWSGQSGDVFKISPTGTVTDLFTFDGSNGSVVSSGLTLGLDGNFYGTAALGGSSGFGTVFKVTPGGTLTTLHNFTHGADAAVPTAPPIQGLDGNFYGNASSCFGFSGNHCSPDVTYGSIYKILPEG
jgi:uncharacterized repeat protein (TIGR03803 family)